MDCEIKRIRIGGLEVPECLFDHEYALNLLRAYLS